MIDELKLDSNWKFCFDPQDQGLLGGWFQKAPENLQDVTLPHNWVPGGKNPLIGFYYNEFTLDPSMLNKKCWIRFDSLDQIATIWLNGVEIGNHVGGHFEVDCNITAHLNEEGSNLLAVRIKAADNPDSPDEKVRNELPIGGWYARSGFAGILGKVTLYTFLKAGIRSLNVFPDYEADRITVETKLWNVRNHTIEIEYTILNPKGEEQVIVKKSKIDQENGSHTVILQFEDGKTWSPWEPNLYQVEACVTGGHKLIRKFGIRRTELERGTFHLNHQPMRIRGVVMPQIFAFSGKKVPRGYNLKKELQGLKDAGFNLIRSGGAPFTDECLDYCDELGLLVLQESTAHHQRSNKEELEKLRAHLQIMVDRNGSHPCIVGWVIGSENGSMVLENGNKLLRYMSELDPSRPAFSNLKSVQIDSQGGGKVDTCKAYDPNTASITPFESHALTLWYPVSVKSFRFAANYCVTKEAKQLFDGLHGNKSFWERYNYMREDLGGKLLVEGLNIGVPESLTKRLETAKGNLSSPEVVKLKALVQELETGFKNHDISVWKDIDTFFEQSAALIRSSLAKQINALSINSQVSGIILSNYADQGTDYSGIVDWSRAPKPIFEDLKRLNRPVRLVIEPDVRTPYLGASGNINIHMVNDADLGDYGLLVRVKGPNGRIWHQESLPGKAERGISMLGTYKFPTGTDKGKFSVDLTLTKSTKEICKEEEHFFVPPPVELDNYLKKTLFAGEFPDTITAVSGDENSPFIILSDYRDLEGDVFEALLEKVKNDGANLIFANLTRESASYVNELQKLPFKVACFRSTGSSIPSLHYIKESSEFKDLPNGAIMNEIYADIAPHFSIKPPENSESVAGSITFPIYSRGESKVRFGSNLCKTPLGKGKLVFCQFTIFDKLGENALADALYGNILDSLS